MYVYMYICLHPFVYKGVNRYIYIYADHTHIYIKPFNSKYRLHIFYIFIFFCVSLDFCICAIAYFIAHHLVVHYTEHLLPTNSTYQLCPDGIE